MIRWWIKPRTPVAQKFAWLPFHLAATDAVHACTKATILNHYAETKMEQAVNCMVECCEKLEEAGYLKKDLTRVLGCDNKQLKVETVPYIGAGLL